MFILRLISQLGLIFNHQAIHVLAYTLQEENFLWNLNLAILLMANSLNFKTAYYCIFRNLSMIAYIVVEIQKSKFANI